MRHSLLLLFSFILSLQIARAQSSVKSDTVSLLFMGDIMGHQSIIDAARSADSLSYNFESMFRRVTPLIQKADFALANLEVTLAGAPYKGYPRFSSPDELVVALKNSGVDVLLTANNHAYDYGRKGLERTLKVLDSLDIKHTGTFDSIPQRKQNNLLILKKGNMRLGVLNYTYSTNGRRVAKPSIVNLIYEKWMAQDIKKSKEKNLDKLIVVLHWGKEYQTTPDARQKEVAKFLFDQGVDIIIGAHPHVLQPMEYWSNPDGTNEKFIAYSMGNFISDQRKSGRDGGAMISIKLVKSGDKCMIVDHGYKLTWVYKPIIGGRRSYKILPVRFFESINYKGITNYSQTKMKEFAKNARSFLDKNNRGVYEKGSPYQQIMTLLNQYRFQYYLTPTDKLP